MNLLLSDKKWTVFFLPRKPQDGDIGQTVRTVTIILYSLYHFLFWMKDTEKKKLMLILDAKHCVYNKDAAIYWLSIWYQWPILISYVALILRWLHPLSYTWLQLQTPSDENHTFDRVNMYIGCFYWHISFFIQRISLLGGMMAQWVQNVSGAVSVSVWWWLTFSSFSLKNVTLKQRMSIFIYL